MLCKQPFRLIILPLCKELPDTGKVFRRVLPIRLFLTAGPHGIFVQYSLFPQHLPIYQSSQPSVSHRQGLQHILRRPVK